MKFKDKVNKLEQEFHKRFNDHVKLCGELDAYRGREIGDNVNKVNELIMAIQVSFTKIYPFMAMVLQQYNFAQQAIRDYDTFINDIKQAGAIAVDKKETPDA